MKKTKNLRVSEETYKVLMELKREDMKLNGIISSFDDVISDFFMFLEPMEKERDNEKNV